MSTSHPPVPPRPDAGAPGAIPVPARRPGATAAVVIAIVVASLVAIGVALTIFLSAVDKIGQSAIDQFDEIDHCLHHPHDPTCEVSFTPSP